MSKAKAQRAWLGVEEKRFGLTRSGLLASEPCTPGTAALAAGWEGTWDSLSAALDPCLKDATAQGRKGAHIQPG